MTCDAWQASNVDGYFAVTGSWINESTPGDWEMQTALLGFVRLNNAHNGKRLGKAMYKIALRLKIAHKVSLIDYISHQATDHAYYRSVGQPATMPATMTL